MREREKKSRGAREKQEFIFFFSPLLSPRSEQKRQAHPLSTPLLAETANGLANTSRPDEEEDDDEEGEASEDCSPFSSVLAAETEDPRAQVPGSVASSALIAAVLSADEGMRGRELPLRCASRSCFLLLSSASRRQRARIDRIEPWSPSELRRSLRPGRTTTPPAVSNVIFSYTNSESPFSSLLFSSGKEKASA